MARYNGNLTGYIIRDSNGVRHSSGTQEWFVGDKG
jgi:hypothetical protein